MSQSSLLKSLLDLIFPPRCEVCDTLGEEPFCASCREQMISLDHPYCRLCGHLFRLSEARQTLCPVCREKLPHFDGARSVGLHVTSLRRAIIRFKFENCRRLQEPLGLLLAQRFAREIETAGGLPWRQIDCLVPVPLHPKRRDWRGFDQSLHLAQAMSAHCGVPVVSDGMIRVRPTTPQVKLSTQARRENVRRAFRAVDDRLQGRNILLIDDVYTTGATASEAARAAKDGGAAAAYALTISRPPPNWHPAALAMEPGDA
ncbi:MAG: double zinc ribbon domain-containing protein [Armatimonadota bacterium]